MDKNTELTTKNYINYAKYHYNGIRVSNSDDFSLTLRTISRIKKIIENDDVDKERLVLNYIIILTNSFGGEPTVKLLSFLIPEDHHTILNTYLLFFGLIQDENIDNTLYSKLENL